MESETSQTKTRNIRKYTICVPHQILILWLRRGQVNGRRRTNAAEMKHFLGGEMTEENFVTLRDIIQMDFKRNKV